MGLFSGESSCSGTVSIKTYANLFLSFSKVSHVLSEAMSHHIDKFILDTDKEDEARYDRKISLTLS